MIKKLIFILALIIDSALCFTQEVSNVTTEINTPLTSEIGDIVFSHSEMILTKAILIKESYTQSSGFIQYNHFKGSKYPIQFSKKGFDFYFLKNNRKDGRYWGIAVKSDNESEVYEALISLANIPKVIKKHPLVDKTQKTKIVDTCDRCFRKELIYNGISENTLKFAYREYIDDLARPSYFQELEYDLDESSIIGFRGLRLEVIKASNISINYIVLKTLN